MGFLRYESEYSICSLYCFWLFFLLCMFYQLSLMKWNYNDASLYSVLLHIAWEVHSKLHKSLIIRIPSYLLFSEQYQLYILKGRPHKWHRPSEPKRVVVFDMPGSRKEDAVWEVLHKLRWSLSMSNIATDISVADRFSWAIITKTKADRFAVVL